MAKKKKLSRERKRTANREQLHATCNKLEVPAVVAVQLLAGVLDEASIETSLEREQWRAEYQEEKTLLQSGREGVNALKNRRAEQIMLAFDASKGLALSVLSGTVKPRNLVAAVQQAKAKQERRAKAKKVEQRNILLKKWKGQVIAVLVAEGLPQEMAESLAPRREQINLDFSPADAAAQLWQDCLQKSGFGSDDLISAWKEHKVWTAEQLRRVQERQVLEANAGMLPDRIAALCSAERIESTLRTVFHLNHWAKARDLLLYADRQGLYKVKARLLQDAYKAGHGQAVAYIAGPEFNPFAEITEIDLGFVLERFHEEATDIQNGHQWNTSERVVTMYKNATGCEIVADEPIDVDAVEKFLVRRLDELRSEAIETRQPIESGALDELLISPEAVDPSRWEMRRFLPGWDDLDSHELGSMLDPEWRSLVEFCYVSESARFTFHVPFRTAEAFMDGELPTLQANGERHREVGEFYGRGITPAESMAHPVRELLDGLGVEISVVCPEHLVDKAEHVRGIEEERAARAYWRRRQYDEDDWGDHEDDW